MTELRIYPEHDKIVITHERSDKHDLLLDIVGKYEEWHDDEWTYYRMPLSEFMSNFKVTE